MSFDEAKPPFNSLLVSADHRNNFDATRKSSYVNMVLDPLFEIWPDSDTVMPVAWVLSGAGATVSRDTLVGRIGAGVMGPRITFGAAIAIGAQQILDASSYDDFFDARNVTAGCHVHADTIGIAKIRIDDGVDQTDSDANLFANPADPEFLSLEHEVNAAATKLEIQVRVESAGSATYSGATFLFSDIKPARFHLPSMVRGTIVHARKAEIFTGPVDRYSPQRPFIVEHVQLDFNVAVPTGADAIVDVNQFDSGAVFTSMFTAGGRPRVLDGAGRGGAAPDGVYNRKCFSSHFGAALPSAGGLLQTEIDQVGSTLTGNDLNIYIRYKAWARPQEIMAAFDAVGQ